jgi:TPR repeat protein
MNLEGIPAFLRVLAILCPAAVTGCSHNLAELRQKAELGEAEAQYSLGEKHRKGDGVPQSYAEAVQWYRMAALQGYAPAQYELAFAHTHGLGGAPQDLKLALELLRNSGESGYREAHYALGVRHYSGWGARQDHVAAAKWFHQAAEQGHVEAQYRLGIANCGGFGVPQDPVRARMWFNLVASKSSGLAQALALRGRDFCSESLTEAQIVEAERMARDWAEERQESE